MVQVFDSLETLGQQDGGFSLHSSDGRLNAGLVNALQSAGVPFDVGLGMKDGLSNTFAVSAAGARPDPGPAPLQPEYMAPRVRLSHHMGG